MAGVDKIRFANNGWHSYPQHAQYREGKMKHPDRDKQAQSAQSEHNDNQDKDQIHIDEYV